MPLCATHPANSCLRICMQAQYLVSLLQWPLYRCRSAGTCALCVLTSKWGICHVLTYNLTRGGVLLGLKDVVTITPELTAAASVPLSSTCTTACMYHSTSQHTARSTHHSAVAPPSTPACNCSSAHRLLQAVDPQQPLAQVMDFRCSTAGSSTATAQAWHCMRHARSPAM